MENTTVVILGGGVGGLVAANELRHLLPSRHRVVLIEKNPVHAFAPSFLWVMTGDRKPEAITTPLRRLLRPGVDVIEVAATRIDVAARLVFTSAQRIGFDYLILALGAELAPEMIPGLAESASSFYSFGEAQRLHTLLAGFPGGRIALVVSSLPYKCPGAPYEGAMLIADYFQRRGLHDQVKVHLFCCAFTAASAARRWNGLAFRESALRTVVAFSIRDSEVPASRNALNWSQSLQDTRESMRTPASGNLAVEIA